MQNAIQSILTACHAQYITNSTSPALRAGMKQVRPDETYGIERNWRLPKGYSLATKKNTLKFIFKIFIGIFFSIPFFCIAQSEKQTIDSKKITIHFQNIVGEKLLQTDSGYQNSFGEPFTIRSFKYYVSNIVLHDDATGKTQTYTEIGRAHV